MQRDGKFAKVNMRMLREAGRREKDQLLFVAQEMPTGVACGGG